METKILEIDDEAILLASKLLNEGEVVAFPTETVYGLGFSAYDDVGVKKIFEVKGRPSDNPLIVHIGSVSQLSLVARRVTDIAKKLFDAFSPGPITIVLDKNPKIANSVTAGLDTVGVRIPSHEGALSLLNACKIPLAAPSANTSTRPSPTDAATVFSDLNGKIPLILDGGECEIGIESTVVDCRGEIPIILREGKVTREDIISVVGACELSGKSSEVRSPGVKYKHYAPISKMYAISCKSQEENDNFVKSLTNNYESVAVMCADGVEYKECFVFHMGNCVEDFMKNYYTALRTCEKNAEVILFVLPFERERAEGLYNRVSKSTDGNII